MRTTAAVLACLLATGCVSTNVRRLDDTPRPARSPETVAVLTQAPERPYLTIAIIESKSGAVFDSFDDLRREMVARAAKLGGDALVLDPQIAALRRPTPS